MSSPSHLAEPQQWNSGVAVAAGLYAVAGGLITLVGWVTDVQALTDWKGDGISMFPNPAACAVMSGLTIVANTLLGPSWRTATRFLTGLVALTGVLTLCEHISGINFGIDTLLFDRAWGQVVATAPMRMGPPAALSFVLIGTALMLSTYGPRARSAASALAVGVIAITALSLIGHLYGAQQMYSVPRLAAIAMQTASMLLALGIGVIASLPEREPMRALMEPGAAGILTRWALPTVIVLAVMLGWLRVLIQRHDLVDAAFGTALRTIVEIVLLMGLLSRAVVMLRSHERALRASEAEVRRQASQLAAFLETAAIGLHRIGPDGIILWANDAELQTLGYDRTEYIGHHIAEFHADQEVIADILARLHRGEKVFEYPAQMKCRDGSLKSVLIDSSVLWEDGRFVHTQCFTREITERHRREETQALLAAIVEASDDAIISKTLDGTVTSWNVGAEHIFGYRADEMIGQSIMRIVPPDRAADVTKILATIGRGDRVEHFESERLRKDGRRIDVSLAVSPIRNAAGEIVGASKVARDVTAQKRAEAERRRALRELATLYAVGQAVAGELDRERVLQTITDAATELSGAMYGAFFYNTVDESGAHYLLHTLSGAPREAFEGFGAPRNTPVFAPTFTGKGVVRVTDIRKDPRYGHNAPHYGTPTGHLPVTSYLAVPVISPGGDVFGGLFLGHPEPGVFTEESERVVVALAAQAAIALENARLFQATQDARAAAEEASRAKDQFLAMLSHELRNPLASVRNAVTTAVLDPASSRRALEIARHGTDQLTRIVDDLLDVARITQGRITLRTGTIALGDVAERARDAVRPLFEERGVALLLSLPLQPIVVQGDAARLEQVVGNLLTNAAKYTEPGGRVTLAVEYLNGQGVLRVTDTGIGIPAELLATVFDLFVQADQTLDRTRGGLGIGLTLVKKLVEMHGGQVTAHSKGLGRGAQFIVQLPATLLAETPPAGDAAKLTDARKANTRVLIVEDNLDSAESLMMLLELLGLRVRVAHDGFSALEKARANPPDVMLIDIGLPGMNGYELAEQIRQDPTLRHVTLVALTGYGQEEDRRRAFAAGFDYHLVKPVDPEKLDRLVAGIAPSKPAIH